MSAMRLTPNERLKILDHFWGWGNKEDAKILFVGIEPNINWSKVDAHEIDRRLDLRRGGHLLRSEFDVESPQWKGRKLNALDGISAYIALKLRAQVLGHSKLNDKYDPTDRANALKSYRADHDGFLSQWEFHADLYPLGAPTTADWPLAYDRMFGKDREEYRRHIEEGTRRQELVELISEFRRRSGYVFLMAKGLWDIVPPVELLPVEGYKMRRSPDCRVWLTCFPGHGRFTYADADFIVQQIRKQHVKRDELG